MIFSKWTVLAIIAGLFLLVIYLRMQKEQREYDEAMKTTQEDEEKDTSE